MLSGCSLKNPTLREEGFTKNQYRGGDCLKKGAWTVCQFKGGGGAVSEGGIDTPIHTML